MIISSSLYATIYDNNCTCKIIEIESIQTHRSHYDITSCHLTSSYSLGAQLSVYPRRLLSPKLPSGLRESRPRNQENYILNAEP